MSNKNSKKNMYLISFIFIICLCLLLLTSYNFSNKVGITKLDSDKIYKYGNIKLNNKLSKKDIENLKEGQKKMTEMLRWFDKVCRENDIKYWVIGGTLIGAIRHNGWIPWDADLDVNMIYEDKLKFDKIIEKNLPANLEYINRNNSIFWGDLPAHSKVRDLYSHHYEGNETEGVCLDIFSIKKVGDNLSGVSNILGFNTNISPILGAPDKCIRSYSDIFPLKEIYFEDVKVYVPNKYKELCSEVWGDYPPKLPEYYKRYPHEGKINPHIPSKRILKKLRLERFNIT